MINAADSSLDAQTKLTPKQWAFVEEYVRNGGNGVRAALHAYDTECYNTANQLARGNLQNPTIKTAINGLMRAFAMGPDEVTWRLSEHARVDITEYFTEDKATGEFTLDLARLKADGKGHLIREIQLEDGKVKVRAHCAQSALVHLGKINGQFKDKLEVSGTLSIDDVGDLARKVKAKLEGAGDDGD